MRDTDMKQLSREMELALDAINSGIYVCNSTMHCIYCNKAYEDITGISRADAFGKTPAMIVKEGLASNSVAVICVEKRYKVSQLQSFPNGRTALVTGCPLFQEDGNLYMVVITVTDVTAQNDLYENLMAKRLMERESESTLCKMIDRHIVRASSAMKETIAQSLRAAFSDATVLITGETGTGKEVVANIIHNNSSRSDYNMIKVNCGAISKELADAELFGYVSGAFTGAAKGGRAGLFEMANHGTIFLDEIGELSMEVQTKLLRVLQEHEIRRVGASHATFSDFRLIAATNKDLRTLVNRGEFRSDLYYRINVINIKVAPLRERTEDILPLLHQELEDHNNRYGGSVQLSSRAEEFFCQYSWPGNVRELKNTVERLFFSIDSDIISLEDIQNYTDTFNEETLSKAETEAVWEARSLRGQVRDFERKIIAETLKHSQTMKAAAEKLQIDPATLTRKCQAYKLDI